MSQRAVGVGIVGIEGVMVDVEVDRHDGLPGIDITGLASASIRESRHRVRSAFRAAAFEWPKERLLANFAPADLPKAGTSYDLPLAVAVIRLLGEVVPAAEVDRSVFYGELGLDGSVRPVPGAINAALATRRAGRERLFVAVDDAPEAAAVPDIDVVGVNSLTELVGVLRGERSPSIIAPARGDTGDRGVDLKDLRGQTQARRALEVAAAGGHNLLLIGPPGCGKTLAARALPSILPPLDLIESLEVSRVHSVAGTRRPGSGLVRQRPFRAPHSTASYAALVGGGNPPRPGEVSLAHRGVLFLDETPEFSRSSLESLRQPLEDRTVCISRAGRRVTFPAAFTLVCALNPCPCGYLDDPRRPCRCTPGQIDGYRSRLSGPLLDRIDIQVALAPVPPELLAKAGPGEASLVVRQRIQAARERQLDRNSVRGQPVLNGELDIAGLEVYAALGREESLHLVRTARALGLTARSWHRIIRVARTIADLAGATQIGRRHLSEALMYRRSESSGATPGPGTTHRRPRRPERPAGATGQPTVSTSPGPDAPGDSGG